MTSIELEPSRSPEFALPSLFETKEQVVQRVARETGFSANIIKTVIQRESNWDCTAVGKAGEIGCLQIMPWFHPNVDPMNFEDSVRYFISESKAGRCWQWTTCPL